MGTKDIPNLNNAIQATWHASPAATETPSHDVEMVEDQRRGDMEEDD
jgi:hypothetical protein